MPRDAAGNNYPVQNASEDTISIYLMTNIVNTENRYLKKNASAGNHAPIPKGNHKHANTEADISVAKILQNIKYGCK